MTLFYGAVFVAVLQRVLRRRATGNLLDSVDSNAVVKGWVTKVSTTEILGENMG